MERARKVWLITHAAPDGNCAEGLGSGQHKSLSHLNAPTQHIVAWGCAKRAFKRTAEVAGAKAQEFRELLNGNPSRQIGFYICDDPACLPGGETSAYDVRFCAGSYRSATRTKARYSAQECDGMRDVRSCRIAVSNTSSACGFYELRGNDRQLLCQRFMHRRVS